MPPKHPRFERHMVVIIHAFHDTPFTNQPSADTEFPASATNVSTRVVVDLSAFKEARFWFFVRTAGVAGADMRCQFSPDESAWTNLDGSAGPELSLAATGSKVSAWFPLPQAARRSVVLRLMAKDGDAAADPRVGNVGVELR